MDITTAKPGRRLVLPLLLLGITVMGSSCSDPSPPDPLPQVDAIPRILFPPARSLTSGDNLAVAGTTTHWDTVDSLTVNGIAATTSNAFETWRARIPLTPGANSVSIIVTHKDGHVATTSAAAQVSRIELFVMKPQTIAFDAANNRALFADSDLQALLSLNLQTGIASVISDANTGTGPVVSGFGQLALDAANNRALSIEQTGLLAVDLTTGNRSMVSNATTGAGPSVAGLIDIALDAPANRVIALHILRRSGNYGIGSMLAIDLASGNRTVISEAGIGTPTVFEPRGLALDIPHNRAIATHVSQLLQIDLASGVSASLPYLAPPSSEPASIVLNAGHDQALVADQQLGVLRRVDLATGATTVAGDDSVNPHPGSPLVPGDLALDATNQTVLAIAADNPVLFATEIATGNRSILNSDLVGSGRTLALDTVVYDAVLTRLLAVTASEARVTVAAIDTATGDRTVISDSTTGTGPALIAASDLALDAARNRLLLTQCDFTANDLIAVDLATGNRSAVNVSFQAFFGGRCPSQIAVDHVNNLVYGVGDLPTIVVVDQATGAGRLLSGNVTGGGPAFQGPPTDIVFDGPSNRLLAASSGELFAVDTATGNRTILSGPGTGSGPDLSGVRRIVLDGAAGRVFAILGPVGARQIIAIDLTTGDRTLVSGGATGAGVALREMNDLAWNDAAKTLYVSDEILRAVAVVDRASGDRAILSR